MSKYCKYSVSHRIGLLVAMGIVFTSTGLKGEDLTLTVNAGNYLIIEEVGGQRVDVVGFGNLAEPGKPMLPAKSFLIALPPGALVRSVNVIGINVHPLPGTYRIVPSPPILPMVDPNFYQVHIEKMQREWQRNNEMVYSSDRAYPTVRGKLKGSGTLRKYAYASVSFYPFDYHPLSGKLTYYNSARITINYDLPSPGIIEAQRIEKLMWDTVADERAARLFVNFEQIKGLYQPTGLRSRDWQDISNYVIITTANLSNAITSSDFLDWKASLGNNVRIVLTTDTEISSQPGSDLAQQIRNFLMHYYGSWGVEYVLLVGDYATVPMRYCYPDSTNHWNDAGDPSTFSGEVPTDYYYADLSDVDADSWDSDGDGFYGEYGQDNPDFMAEVYIGRIPTNDPARITYALDKLVNFEQDTGNWKDQVLHGGAILFYENENYSGYPKVDGATVMHHIEADLMTGWTISHYSEQEGLAPSEYVWPALSEAAFIGDWRNGQYGVVNWAGHGFATSASRSVWSWDDGDSVPESPEISMPLIISTSSNLDNDHPSIVFAISCLVGYPEPNAHGRLGVDLLTKPSFGSSAGVISASRPAAASAYWPTAPGLAQSMCYEFNRHMINGPSGPEKVGDALYDSKFFCNYNYGWDHWYEYLNMFDYNLYGDPALVRESLSEIPTLSEWGMIVLALLLLTAGTVTVVRRKKAALSESV